MKSRDGAPKLERKTVEKNRRIQMKNLIFKLSSLIPDGHKCPSKDALTQQDYLDQTTSYIKHMKEKIQRLKQRKGMLTGDLINKQKKISKLKFPMVEIRQRDSSMEVVMVSMESKQSLFYEVMSILEEEGAEVINASSSVVGDKVFHTIHCHELCSTVGLNAYKIYERLEGLLACTSNGSELLSSDMAHNQPLDMGVEDISSPLEAAEDGFELSDVLKFYEIVKGRQYVGSVEVRQIVGGNKNWS